MTSTIIIINLNYNEFLVRKNNIFQNDFSIYHIYTTMLFSLFKSVYYSYGYNIEPYTEHIPYFAVELVYFLIAPFKWTP